MSSYYQVDYPQRPSHSQSDSFPPPTKQDYDHRYDQDRRDDDDDDEEEGSGFNTFADFNNTRRLSQNRLSSYADLSTPSNSTLLNTTAAPKISTNDWQHGEGSKELEAKALRRRTLIQVEKKSRSWWSLATGEGRWKRLVFIVFGFLCALGITLYFVIPRVPAITFLSANPLSSNDLNATTSASPASFSFFANVSLAIDARESYVPVNYKSFQLLLSEITSSSQIATGSLPSLTVPGRTITNILVPVRFQQSYQNTASAGYGIIRSACTHLFTDQTRPSLSLILSVRMSIVGIIGETATSAQLNGIPCPVQFAANAP